jgi:hypothetical protein
MSGKKAKLRRRAVANDNHDGTPILRKLWELDEVVSAKQGPDWVYTIPPDPNGPFVIVNGDEWIIGPKARACILEMRQMDRLPWEG